MESLGCGLEGNLLSMEEEGTRALELPPLSKCLLLPKEKEPSEIDSIRPRARVRVETGLVSEEELELSAAKRVVTASVAAATTASMSLLSSLEYE